MQTRALGGSGISVSAIGLGGMPLSLATRPDEAAAIAVIHASLDAGVTFIDTADVYCIDDRDLGHNERLIARALRERPSARVTVATKGGLERPGGAWTTNGTPKHLRAACERSLVALGVEAIDLYQLHAPDSKVPFEDSIGALAELQRAGKIRHIGISNVSVAELDKARAQVTVVSVQNRANPFDVSAFESGVAAACHRAGIAFLPHSPVGGHRGHARATTDPTLTRIAQRHGATPYEVCLAFLLALSPWCIPIPGASKISSAVSSARAADLVLTAEDLAELRLAFPAVRI